MMSFPATVMNEELSELETEAIEAYVVRESVYIVEDELEFFFTQKQKLLEILAAGIDLNSMSSRVLQEKMNRVLVAPQDLEIILAKIQKRICRELDKANCRYAFHLRVADISRGLPQFELAMTEQLRTLKLSRTVAKGIDTAWKKACKNLLPKPMTKVGSKIRIGEYLVATLAIGAKEQELNITAGYLKVAKTTLRQYRIELMNNIIKEITKQLFKVHTHCDVKAEEMQLKYA